MAPDKPLEDAVVHRTSKDPASEAWWSEFENGRQIKLGEIDRPSFMPKSDVATETKYGLEIYHKIGLVPEPELLRLTGLTAKQAKKKCDLAPISVKLDGPLAPSSLLYPIGLRGLPPDEIASILKAKVMHNVSVLHSESTLKSEYQICQQQGLTLFGISAATLKSNRPVMNPQNIHDVAKLREKKRELDAEQAQTGPKPGEDESSDEVPPDDEEIAAAAKAKLRRSAFSMGSLQSTAAKKQPKAKAAKAKPKASAPGSMAPPTPPAITQGRDESPSTHRESSHRKLSKQDRLVEEAIQSLQSDEEMLRVAKKHLQVGKGSSVKCLTSMNLETILRDEVRPNNNRTGVCGLRNIESFFRVL